MSQQNLDDADVHALLQHVRGKAVPKRVWPKTIIEAALASSLDESDACGGIGKMADDSPTGEQPAFATVCLPDLAKHLQDRLGQRESSLAISLPDHVKQ